MIRSRRLALPVLGALVLGVLALGAPAVRAQTIDDGLMMPKHDLCTGFLYQHDAWDEYWEGARKRSNGNIGTLTTRSLSWVGTYGVTDRLNVIAMLPFVSTGASAGTLRGMHGVQDVTLAAKYSLLARGREDRGRLRAFAVAAAGTPASDYTPDFLPLSIGMASRRFSSRLTLHYWSRPGWFLGGSAAYTWRGQVTLDRPAYYTGDQLYLSDKVAMPDVFDYTVTAGYRTRRLYAPVSFTQQFTRGGSDIRRQDMPFVSNRMDFSRLDAAAVYSLPRPGGLSVRLGAGYTVAGRNVGQSTTLTAGLLYTVHFGSRDHR